MACSLRLCLLLCHQSTSPLLWSVRAGEGFRAGLRGHRPRRDDDHSGRAAVSVDLHALGLALLLSGEEGETFCRGSTRFYVDMPWLVGLYQAGRLPIDKLSSRHYPPDQYNEAQRALEVRGIARSLLDVTQL